MYPGERRGRSSSAAHIYARRGLLIFLNYATMFFVTEKRNTSSASGRRGERGGEAGEPAALSMTNGENTILQGKIFEPLIRFTLPLMLAILIQALYGAVDLMIVGKFGSTPSVAAVSNGGQIMQTVSDFMTGLSMGVTVLIGQAVGARDKDRASKTFGAMVTLFLTAGVALSAVMYFCSAPIAELMKIPAEAKPKMVEYLRICSCGIVFITAFNVIAAMFRGLGDSKSPLQFITVACLFNVAGDLLLVGVLRMDVAGAAIATVFAQGASVVFSIWKMKKDGLPFPVDRAHLRNNRPARLRIAHVGAPMAFQDLLISISFLIIMAIINDIGLVESASVGIAEKLYVFLALVPISFIYSLSAFVAQNIGAKQEHRAVQSMVVAMRVSFVFGLVTFSLTFFAGTQMASIFADDPAVITATASYLRSVGAEYLMIPIAFCFLGYFSGIGHTRFVFAEGLVSSFVFRIPLCWYFSTLPDTSLAKIGLSVPLSAVAALTMCVAYYFHIRRRRERAEKNLQ